MKKTYGLFAASTVMCIIVFMWYTNYSPSYSWKVPESIQELAGPEGKNAPWSIEFAKRFYKEQSLKAIKNNNKSPNGAYADGGLFGFWENKGPYNMPGAWQFCEMDEGTDTIYAVTCGHYGGTQFIWKGTLWDDKWTMINPKNPARFEDVIVVQIDGKRRVLAGKQAGGLMYTDDAGHTWQESTGLPAIIHSTIVNKQDSDAIYVTASNGVYVSTNFGSSFQLFQTLPLTSSSRMYSPRWDNQPGANEVYLTRDKQLFKLNLNKTAFNQIATINYSGNVNRIAMSGDNRSLWVVYNGNQWYASTNGGTSFNFMPTTGYWYNNALTGMNAGQFIGINPEDPTVFIGGYSVPLVGKNSGATTIAGMRSYWGVYQNAVGNDDKVRNNYHPDFQSNQFFYDKDGKLLTLRSSDGGMFISYNEWKKDAYNSYADMEGVFYNISLFDKPSQETYRGGFIYGYLNPDHLTAGTQDQGWQNTRPSSYGSGVLSWDQIQGGDGPCCITGDGKIGWSYNYLGTGAFRRFPLYNGTTYVGLQGAKSGPFDANFTAPGSWYFTPSVGDWENGNRIWVLSSSLRRITFDNNAFTAKEDLFGSGQNYIQGLAQSRQTANVIYTMRSGIVHKSSNRGDTWIQIANANVTGITGFKENRGMAWAIDDNTILFATQSGTAVKSIFSTNGGVSWENVTGFGENRFPNAEVNGMAGSKDGKYVFASTNMGPYVFVVETKKWYPLATDAQVPEFWGQIVYCVDYGDKEVVHFSTWGQGVWDFVIEENPLNNDIALISLDIPSDLPCGDLTNWQISYRNLGNQVLESFEVEVYINNQLQESIQVVTNLTKGAFGQLNLPNLAVNNGDEVKVLLINPSGVLDENMGNNQQKQQISMGELMDQNLFSVVSFSSQEISGEGTNNGRAIYAVDGDPSTFWHAQWTGAGSTMPHELVFDLGEEQMVGKIGWMHRQNNNNGNIKEAQISFSEDGTTWSTQQLIELANGTQNQIINLNPIKAKFVKVIILNNFNNTNVASLAELNFYGCDVNDVITQISQVESSQIKVYPVPFTNELTIEGKNVLLVQLFTLSGAMVKQQKGDKEVIRLNTTDLSPGIYVLSVMDRSGIQSKKVIKK